jgi:hypothetical protein
MGLGKLCVLAAVVVLLGGSTEARLARAHYVANTHYCDGCIPPLLYDGGPIVTGAGSTGLTITPVFWAPSGATFTPSADKYIGTISKYIADLQDASGTTGNVYSIGREYYGKAGGRRTYFRYKITAGEPIVDTSPFPAGRCKVVSRDFDTCISDGQLRAELLKVIKANGLPTGLSAFYPVFFPDGVMTSDGEGSNSVDGYCGYHSYFGNGAGAVIYANMPLELENCDGGQAPNGSTVVDGAIDTLSHEVMEAITDPLLNAWSDTSGSEIGDICAGFYGAPLGSTNPADPSHSLYNQAIGSGKYYTQTEFSNAAYAKFGVGGGCQQSASAVGRGPSAKSGGITLQSQLIDLVLPADGKSTTHDNVYVTNRQGDPVPKDPISVSTYLIAGTGTCGKLSKTTATTDATGAIDVVYTVSTSNAECGIVATEGRGGKTITAPLYQGTYQRFAPTGANTFPGKLQAGADNFFTVTYGNRTSDAIPFGTVDFAVFPDTDSAPKPAGIRLSASTHGSGGPFLPLKISTGYNDGHVEARFVGTDKLGVTIPAHRKFTLTIRLTLAASAPSRGTKPIWGLEGFLDQLNPATGTFTTIADSGYEPVAVIR